MGLIFLFRRLVFAQVLLGIAAFCMAEGNPGMLLVAGALAALSWYVVEGPTGKPLPQWVIVPGAFAAVGWLLLDLFWQRGEVIQPMGHFTMWLQILLLYGKKRNREYGQILVLSLMQMIGASVLGVSVGFGLMLLAYTILSLFTLLLFQLTITSDEILENNRQGAPQGVQVLRPRAVVCRGHKWHFRATAMMVGAACAFISVMVFLMMPRTGESRLSENFGTGLGGKRAGFSQTMTLDGTPLSQVGSRQPVLYLHVSQDDQTIRDPHANWLLRGAVLDQYDPSGRSWRRSAMASARDLAVNLDHATYHFARTPDHVPLYHVDVTLLSDTDRALFTLLPIVSLTSASLNNVTFNIVDQQLRCSTSISGVTRYEFTTPVLAPPQLHAELTHVDLESLPELVVRNRRQARPADDRNNYARGWPNRPAIRQTALDILKEAELTRAFDQPHDPGDPRIAAAMAQYLQTRFQYDLTNPTTSRDQDPIVEFLTSHRRGHCELFASAMAAMARSIGMRARVITGYRASEFNRIGGYYVVRRANAHAWCEIDLGPEHGWVIFDPTPPDQLASLHDSGTGVLSIFRELYEFVEFSWTTSVVAYSSGNREQLITHVSRAASRRDNENSAFQKAVGWVRELPQRWQIGGVTWAIIGVMVAAIIIGVISLVHTLIMRRRRQAALQLTRLPRKQRRALARRLKFYLVMLDTLERYGYVRPTWQSPFGFAQELADANPMRFDPVVALTEIFYEIRFGHRELDDDRQIRIRAHLRQLEHALAQKVS